MADFPALGGGGGGRKKGGKAPASGSPSWGRRSTAAASGGASQSWPGLGEKPKIKSGGRQSGGISAVLRAPTGPTSASAGFAGASTATRGRGRGRGRGGRGNSTWIKGDAPPPQPTGRGWGKQQQQQQQKPASSWPGLDNVGGGGLDGEGGGGGGSRGGLDMYDAGVDQNNVMAEMDTDMDTLRQQQLQFQREQPLQGGVLVQKAADRVEVVGLRSFAAVRDTAKRTGLWGKQLSHLHLRQNKRYSDTQSMRVREHYLRDDIPCRYRGCTTCTRPAGKDEAALGVDLTHILVPDYNTCADFLEVLELPEFHGIVFPDTVVRHLKRNARTRSARCDRRVRELIHDVTRQSVVYSNEHSQDTYLPRDAGTTVEQHALNLAYRTAEWFAQHLYEQSTATTDTSASTATPAVQQTVQPLVVFLTDDPDLRIKSAQQENEGDGRTVEVLSVAEYLDQYYPTHSTAKDLLDSLILAKETAAELAAAAAAAAAIRSNSGDGNSATAASSSSATRMTVDPSTGYAHYLPKATAVAGVKSGMFLKGALRVSKHDSQNEAYVTFGNVHIQRKVSSDDVLIVGDVDRNRAVHGDSVAIELFPRAQWHRRTEKGTPAAAGGAGAGGSSASSGGGGDGGGGGGDNSTAADGTDGDDDSMLVPTGRVVCVLETRGWRTFVATLHENDAEGTGSKVMGVPMDGRLPKVRFATRDRRALAGKRIVLRIDEWPADSRLPRGHFVKSLGPAGDVDVETAAILIELDISTQPFSSGQYDELPTDSQESPWLMDPAEIARRRDIRKSHLVFSIDPLGCEDVDDALCARALDNGNVELSVHIADVSYFVKPGSLNDREAQRRGTTVYMCDRRYDMLPEVLSANLCSLLGDVDRYATSVFWELDPNDGHKVITSWFGKTVIRSSYKLDYGFAQDVADGMKQQDAINALPRLKAMPSKANAKAKVEELRVAVQLLMKTARAIRTKRIGVGALELSSAEMRVKLGAGDKKTVEDLVEKTGLEIHDTIAECMIFANRAVAERITAVFPSSSLLRRHPPARQEHLTRLTEIAAERGFVIDASSNYTLARSLDAAVDPNDPELNNILRMMATQSMERAVYFATGTQVEAEWYHYGLGLSHYTHFTSPIRRYADVVVHRLLMASIAAVPNVGDAGHYFGIKKKKEVKPSGGDADGGDGGSDDNNTAEEEEEEEEEEAMVVGLSMEDMSTHINIKNEAAKVAQTQSLDIFLALYFSERKADTDACTVEAVVTDIRNFGVVAFVPRFGFKGAVWLSDRETGKSRIPAGMLGRTPLTDPVEGGEFKWTPSSVTATPPEGAGKPITLRRFDRIKVLVTVDETVYRIGRLKLHLQGVGKGGNGGGNGGGSSSNAKAALVEGVLKHKIVGLPAAHTMPESAAGGENTTTATATAAAAVGKKKKPVYDLLERFKSLALVLDDE